MGKRYGFMGPGVAFEMGPEQVNFEGGNFFKVKGRVAVPLNKTNKGLLLLVINFAALPEWGLGILWAGQAAWPELFKANRL